MNASSRVQNACLVRRRSSQRSHLRVPAGHGGADAQKHAQADLGDDLRGVSEVAASLGVGFGEKVLHEATPDVVSHLVELLVHFLDAVLVVVQHLPHDGAVRQREELRVLRENDEGWEEAWVEEGQKEEAD